MAVTAIAFGQALLMILLFCVATAFLIVLFHFVSLCLSCSDCAHTQSLNNVFIVRGLSFLSISLFSRLFSLGSPAAVLLTRRLLQKNLGAGFSLAFML